MLELVMVVLGFILVLSWGNYHLRPVGKHVRNDSMPVAFHLAWLFLGLLLFFMAYILLAVE